MVRVACRLGCGRGCHCDDDDDDDDDDDVINSFRAQPSRSQPLNGLDHIAGRERAFVSRAVQPRMARVTKAKYKGEL